MAEPISTTGDPAAPKSGSRISISVVSHRQAALVHELLGDLQQHCRGSALQVVLTINLPEAMTFREEDFSFELIVIHNAAPKGFGANHNAAAAQATGDYFCVLNPDIRLSEDPFPALVQLLRTPATGVVSAQVLSPAGGLEDHARPFPTASSILKKVLSGTPDALARAPANPSPDWIAGMFMLFDCQVFRKIGGFDERYFLYYEDVDVCRRLRRAGYQVRVEPAVKVVHDARRQSHRNLRYLGWHLRSLLRFLLVPPGELPPLS